MFWHIFATEECEGIIRNPDTVLFSFEVDLPEGRAGRDCNSLVDVLALFLGACCSIYL